MKRAAATAIAAAIVTVPLAATSGTQGKPIRIQAGSLPLVRSIDERFQSFQIGFSHLTGGETWRSYDSLPKGQLPGAPGDVSAVREPRPPADLSSKRLRTLTAALAPFYLRYSGTTANSAYFQDDDGPALAKAPAGYTVVLTRQRWKEALDFARAVDARVVTSFTTSPGVRDGSGGWTPRMAAPWLAYSQAIGGRIHAAELYNEPNAPEPGIAPKGHTAAEYARDFASFRSFMAKAAPGVKLAGPGTATLGIPVRSIDHVGSEDYATASPTPKFDVVSYHFYPALAQRCAPPTSPLGISSDNALTAEWLARPDRQLQRHKALRDRHAPGAPIWITETGGAACGGLVWQPTFLDMFRYLDTHARLAKQGADAMFTHALISGSNGIIDEKSYLPNASYWGALLWRRLMGSRVLDAGPARPGLHLYAHCMRGTPGGVSVLAINLGDTPASLKLSGRADLYVLTAPELQGKTVLLNGRPLALGADDSLPTMAPVRSSGGEVSVAATSIAFVALPGAGNGNCQGPRNLAGR